MGIAAPIKTNYGKVETIIGAEDLGITLCRSSHGQPSRAHRQCIEKLTSCNHDLPHRVASPRAAITALSAFYGTPLGNNRVKYKREPPTMTEYWSTRAGSSLFAEREIRRPRYSLSAGLDHENSAPDRSKTLTR